MATTQLDRGMTNLALSQEMMRAAASDNLDAVTRCLAEGTSPNAVNPIGQTALHIAAIWNNVKVGCSLAYVITCHLTRRGPALHLAVVGEPNPMLVALLLAGGQGAHRRSRVPEPA